MLDIKKIASLLKERNTLGVIALFAVLYFNIPFTNINDNVSFSGYLVLWDKVLQNTVIIWLLLSFYFRTFKLWFIPVGITIGIYEQIHNLFVIYIHPLLLQMPEIYGLLTGSSINRGISAEYPRIIFATMMTILFFLFVCIKKYRTLDRIFISFISVSVLFTSFLFHFIIIKESQIFKDNLYNTMFYTALQKDKELCSNLYLKCTFIDIKDYDITVETLGTARQAAIVVGKEMIKYNKYYKHLNINNPDTNARLIGQIPFTIVKTDNEVAFVEGSGAYKPFLIGNQFIYAYLALTAHIVWITGGLALIYFHRYRFSKRRKERGVN